MAQRRMFSLKIIDTDTFLDMPASTQALYFHLAMRADDDGFIDKPKRIIKMVNCSEDDMRILLGKQFIIPFESGICVIKHWKIHNYIRTDRYNKSIYQKELDSLEIGKNGSYRLKQQSLTGEEEPLTKHLVINSNIERCKEKLGIPNDIPLTDTGKVSIELDIGKVNNNSNNNMPAGTFHNGEQFLEEELFEESSYDDQPVQENNIYSIIESNFGRPLSPMEYETITSWIDKPHPNDLIILAVKEAVIKNNRSIKYIDRILHSWYVSGIKTVADAQKQMDEFHSARENKLYSKSRPKKSETELVLDDLKKEIEGDSNVKY